MLQCKCNDNETQWDNNFIPISKHPVDKGLMHVCIILAATGATGNVKLHTKFIVCTVVYDTHKIDIQKFIQKFQRVYRA